MSNDEAGKMKDEKIDRNDAVKTERMSIKEAQDALAARGGNMNVGDGYASDFLSVEGANKDASEADPVWLNLPLKEDLDMNSVTVYYSKDGKTWDAAGAQDIVRDQRMAKVQFVSG